MPRCPLTLLLFIALLSLLVLLVGSAESRVSEHAVRMRRFKQNLKQHHRPPAKHRQHSRHQEESKDETQTGINPRIRRYHAAKRRRERLRYEQERERLRRAQDEFDSRIPIGSKQWQEKYPLSVFCQNFTNKVSNKLWFQKANVTLPGKEGRLVIDIPCIPAIILPIALDPQGFVPRLFKSIDHCISSLFIYKSNEVDIRPALQVLDKKLVKNIYIVEKPFPIRLTTAWNSGVRKLQAAPWYLFVASDVEFAPFQLGALNKKYWLKSGLLFNVERSVDFVFFNWKNMHPFGYNLFIVKRTVFDTIGFFDENMHPAFFEDADLDRRIDLCNAIPDNRCEVRRTLFREICPWHGKHYHISYETGTSFYEEAHPGWNKFISLAFSMNEKYFRDKWGCPPNTTLSFDNCTFTVPFNSSINFGEDTEMLQGLRKWSVNESRIDFINSFLAANSSIACNNATNAASCA